MNDRKTEKEQLYPLWNADFEQTEIKPIRGIRYVTVHRAVEGAYQFLLGSAIIKHNGVFYCSWGNSYRLENDEKTMLAQKISKDGGLTWTDYRRISLDEPPLGRSHGVYFEHDGALYTFCPKASFEGSKYPGLVMEGYRLQGEAWQPMGIVLDGRFWPLCEPIVLENGTILMAGLETEQAQAAVALCKGGDLTQWEMKVIPNPNGYQYWGETTVLKAKDRLIALARCGKSIKQALISESFDGGNSWSGLRLSNLPIEYSKLYAGCLQNGEQYLIFNAQGEQYRDTLCLALGRDGFERIYEIRRGFDTLQPRFQKKKEWCYPYAYEDTDANRLYVVYAKDKEDCELAIIDLAQVRGD